MREPPHIRHFMSTAPVTVGPDDTLDHALALMEQHGVRHLPVVSGDDLVGLLSQRDIAMAASLGRQGKGHAVREAMSAPVFTCGPEAHVHAVATKMAEGKFGSAVIVEASRPRKVLGVFTTIDALRGLALTTAHLE